MAVNIKLGNNTINGVETLKVADATNPSTYHDFTVGGATVRKLGCIILNPDSDFQYHRIFLSGVGIGISTITPVCNGVKDDGAFKYALLSPTQVHPQVGLICGYILSADTYVEIDPDANFAHIPIFPQSNFTIYIIDAEAYYTSGHNSYIVQHLINGTENYILASITLTASEYAYLFDYSTKQPTGNKMSLDSLLAAHNVQVNPNTTIIFTTNIEFEES